MISSGMMCRQHIQCLHQREQCPTVCSSPEEAGLPVSCLHPAMTEESFFLHEHLFPEKGDLSYRFIEITALTGHCTHLSDGRDAHEHVIEPDGVHLRTFAGKGTVMEPILIVHDVVHVVGNNRFQLQPGIHPRCLDHGGTDGSCIVECRWFEDLPHLRIGSTVISQHLFECRPVF